MPSCSTRSLPGPTGVVTTGGASVRPLMVMSSVLGDVEPSVSFGHVVEGVDELVAGVELVDGQQAVVQLIGVEPSA